MQEGILVVMGVVAKEAFRQAVEEVVVIAAVEEEEEVETQTGEGVLGAICEPVVALEVVRPSVVVVRRVVEVVGL